jgi:uncharacterized protein (DUF885 family)
MNRLLTIIIMALCLAAPPTAEAKRTQANAQTRTLHALFHADWQDAMALDPVEASRHGDKAARDKMPSALPATFQAAAERDAKRLAAVKAIARHRLTPEDRVNADLFQFMLEDRVAQFAFRPWRIPITNDSGFHTGVLFMHQGQPFQTKDDYEAYTRRLAAVGRYMDENIANMREGLRDGFTLPSEIIEGVVTNLHAQQFVKPEDCPLEEPFEKMPDAIPPAIKEQLRSDGRAAISTHVIPAFARLKAFMENEYRPGARKSLGASQLPNGANYYQTQIRSYTTLDLSAQDIHQTGLKEVARIRAQMDAEIAKTGFNADFAAFVKHLREDPKFYPSTERQLLMEASLISKRIDGKLPSYFGKLPRTPYGVIPVPVAIAPNYTAGRYNSPSPDGRRAGFYWVNTHKPETRPLYNLTALTLHEAVPGHHLQIALALEMGEVPKFRKQLYLTAFGEGWALYAEKLGVEMGVYETPYDDFGRLSYEMWRACRLVVDTGIHAMGWTRAQAIDYLASNTALPMREVQTEIDRYISWPGQALGYKLGELKIWELRAKAQHALGATFDLRRFHDAVLENGSVTLGQLEALIDAHIADERKRIRHQMP